MPTLRFNKTEGSLEQKNYYLYRKDMSLKAKGLLSLMLFLSKGAEKSLSISDLIFMCKEGETSIKSAMKELQSFGYLKKTMSTLNQLGGRQKIVWFYDVFDYSCKEGIKRD